MDIPKALLRLTFSLSLLASSATFSQSVIVANNDVPIPEPAFNYKGNTVTFYSLDSTGSVASKAIVRTGGTGIAGGTFAFHRIAVVPQGSSVCVFASDAGTGTIAGIRGSDYSVTGSFFAPSSNDGTANGIGLAASAQYLYASYSSTSTIATFSILPGCVLSYESEVIAVGLNGGLISGMAVRAPILVATYGDGSISSFNISGGAPLSNGDIENATGFEKDQNPAGVIVTSDGHYALFADASTVTSVDVADISRGKLSRTRTFELGTAWNSSNVRLSPDETLLFTTNNSGGAITAAFFDKATGIIKRGCTSGALSGFYTIWSYAGAAALQLATGAGGLIYVPEFGPNGFSSIGVVQLTSTGNRCTLSEIPSSPIIDNDNPSSLLSIETFPIALPATN